MVEVGPDGERSASAASSYTEDDFELNTADGAYWMIEPRRSSHTLKFSGTLMFSSNTNNIGVPWMDASVQLPTGLGYSHSLDDQTRVHLFSHQVRTIDACHKVRSAYC